MHAFISNKKISALSEEESCETAYARAAGLTLTESAPRSSGYDPFQWLIISIGHRDADAGPAWGRFGRALGHLFAWPQPNQLADPKLEQLRRMAAMASQRGWQVPPSEMSAFLRAGWTDDQLELLIDSVAPAASERHAAGHQALRAAA